MADASDSDLLAIARSAYEESIPNFARFLNDLFREHPRGQSEVRVRIDSKRWLRGAFISDFVTEPPWRHDRYLDGLTGQRDVRACVRIGDTAVQIDALSWDDLVLATPREPPSLGPWFDKWFLRPRPLEFDGLRLSGCIHSVQTNSHKDSYVTSIDLGTAKPQAFVELIDTCRRAQIPKVVVGSSYRADWSTD